MNKSGLLQAAELLKNGKVSSLELTKACLNQIKSANNNAVVSLCEEQALSAAARIDNDGFACGGVEGVLKGIPVLIKDNIDVLGLPTTCGSAAFKDNIAKADAECVTRLKNAGAVILGKTNMDEFAMGSSNMTSAFGRVLNPVNNNCVPGGSSGGSAVAVADFQCFAALGSDTGGSIRQPASYCGVVGLKPSYGSVSANGCFPLAPSMDMVGPLARSVGDLAAMFGVISGRDFSAAYAGGIVKNTGKKTQKTKRIGVIKQALDMAFGSAAEALNLAISRLTDGGCEVVEVSVPLFGSAHYIYKVLAFSEIAVSLRAVESDRELLGTEVKKRVIAGSYVLSHPRLMAEAQKIRVGLTAEMLSALVGVDALVLPTAPSAAFGFDDDPNGYAIKHSDMFAQPASIAGLPSLSVPFFTGSDGLPVGIQLVGGMNTELTLFELGIFLESIR